MAESTTMTQELPGDLGRVAGKGLTAMEAFLDEPAEGDIDHELFRRRHLQAKVGSTAVGSSIRFLATLNNREAIALARERQQIRSGSAAEE